MAIDGKTMETVAYFIFLCSKMTVNGDCSQGIKICLFIGKKKKTMANLDDVLKSKDIYSLTKVPIVKTTVSPVVMHGCESLTIKKAEN